MTAPLPSRLFVADRGDDRERLDRVLVRRFADLPVSRVEAARWVRGGRVTVNGDAEGRAARRLLRGDRVAVELPPPPPDAPPLRAEEMALAVIHEDEHLLAVDKPAGLVVHPTWGHRDGTLLNGLLWRAAAAAGAGADAPWRPRLLHRLDRGTSGVLVVAKTPLAQKTLARAWQRREVGKEYLAIVLGRPAARAGRIELAIARDPLDPKRRVPSPDGRPSVTRWELVAESPAGEAAASLLRCRPETGRTHQIRVHLAAAGMPVAGDPLYGAAPPASPLATALAGLGRHALHAAALDLRHPATGERLRLTAPLPADLATLLRVASLLPVGPPEET